MNHLLAKTSGRNGKYLKVISDKIIFDLPEDLENSKDYDSDYKLEEDEWFSIKQFSTKDYSIEFLNRRFISTDYDQIPKDDYFNIEYLCSYQSGTYYFQKLSASQIICKKYFSISKEPKLIENEPLIVIDSFPDAIYIKAKDILYFKNLSSITRIFKGIDVLYKEATQQETEDFLKNDFISLNGGYSADKVKRANRKRIAMAMETLKKFSQRDKLKIFKYIREYCKDLDYNAEDENFTISTEEELKKLLYGIEERYYTTMTGGERRLANSVTLI